MISSLSIFLPTFVCLFSTIALKKLSSRTDATWLLFFLGLATSFFLLSEACQTDARAPIAELMHVKMIGLVAAPCIIPLSVMYMRKLRTPTYQIHSLGLVWILVPAILFTAVGVMYLMIGEATILPFMEEIKTRGLGALKEYRGSTEYVFFVLAELVFRVILAIESLVFIIYVIAWTYRDRVKASDISAFIHEDGSIRVTTLQMLFFMPILVVLIMKVCDLNIDFSLHRTLSVILSLILSVFLAGFGFTALFGSKRLITRKGMRFGILYNYGMKDKGTVVEEMMNILLDEAETEALERVQQKIGKNLHIEEFKSADPSAERSEVASKIFEAVTDTYDESDMLGRFQRLMRDEMLFLKPGLSLDDVADKLETNKFYISKMVNNTFNMGFPEVVNILRVDYAEQYIMSHPNARQAEIAQQCGFFSASTFNTIFKKVTGMTPKMWMAAKEHTE